MPGPASLYGPWGEALFEAVGKGAVNEALIDDKVVRILRLAARVGALAEIPSPLGPPAAAPEAPAPAPPARPVEAPDAVAGREQRAGVASLSPLRAPR